MVSSATLASYPKCHTWLFERLLVLTSNLSNTVWTSKSLKSGRKLAWFCNSCILQACKINIMWMIAKPATSVSNDKVPLKHSCSGLWLFGWMDMGTHFCRYLWISRMPETSFLKAKTFKRLHVLTSLGLQCGTSPCWFPSCLQDVFLFGLMQKVSF